MIEHLVLETGAQAVVEDAAVDHEIRGLKVAWWMNGNGPVRG